MTQKAMEDAAAEVSDSPTNEAFQAAKYAWTNMYLGAFVALFIARARSTAGDLLARELADFTRSDAEASRAIEILRDTHGPAPDRVGHALAWLRSQRGT